MDLNNSRLHVRVKIIKADVRNIDVNTACLINLTLHSMFCEIGLELNGQNVGDPSQLYPYHSHLMSFLNFCKESPKTRLLCEWWTKDSTAHMGVIAVGWNIACLNARAATFARSTVFELIGRPHLHVFAHERVIPPKIDYHMRLMQYPNNFLCKSAAPVQGV